jgi:hypothetical protein
MGRSLREQIIKMGLCSKALVWEAEFSDAVRQSSADAMLVECFGGDRRVLDEYRSAVQERRKHGEDYTDIVEDFKSRATVQPKIRKAG